MSTRQKNDYKAKVTISGAGVMHVRSSEIVKTSEAKRQIKMLGDNRNKLVKRAS